MKPTGKLKFAYDSIANLEQKISRLEYENGELKSKLDELSMAANEVCVYLNEDKYNNIGNNSALHTQLELVLNQTPQQSLNEIKAQAIDEFKSYVKSGLKVLNEPSWEGKRPIIIDENTYFEITLSEFDDYANQLRGV